MRNDSGNPANMADHNLAPPPPLNTPKQTCEFCGCLYSLLMPQHVSSSSLKPNSESSQLSGNFCSMAISDTPYEYKAATNQDQTDTYNTRSLRYTTILDTKMMRYPSQTSAQIPFWPVCFCLGICRGRGGPECQIKLPLKPLE